MASKTSPYQDVESGSAHESTGQLEKGEKDDTMVESNEVTKTVDFPEGGRQAWLTLLGGFLLQYTTFGYTNAFGVYQDFYIRHYLTNYAPSDIGWIGGVQIFLTFSSGLFVGTAFDRGHFYYLLAASIVLHALALFMLSLSHENSFYQVFLTNGVALGLSSGLAYIPSLGITTHYFQKRRPFALGIVSSGAALGAVIHPIMLNKLFNSGIGFHNGVRISGALNVSLLIIAASIMRTRLPPKAVQKVPIGEWFNQPAYLSVVVSAWFIFLGLFFPVFYLQLNAISHGVDRTIAFYALSILNAASFFGRISPGILAPRVGVFNLAIFCMISSGVVVIFMMFVKDVAGTVLVAIFFGFTSGAAISLVPSATALLCKDMSELGTRMGIIFAFAGLLGLFATPISGALLTKDYHWLNASLFSGIALIIGGLFYAIARYFLLRKRGTQTWFI